MQGESGRSNLPTQAWILRRAIWHRIYVFGAHVGIRWAGESCHGCAVPSSWVIWCGILDTGVGAGEAFGAKEFHYSLDHK